MRLDARNAGLGGGPSVAGTQVTPRTLSAPESFDGHLIAPTALPMHADEAAATFEHDMGGP